MGCDGVQGFDCCDAFHPLGLRSSCSVLVLLRCEARQASVAILDGAEVEERVLYRGAL